MKVFLYVLDIYILLLYIEQYKLLKGEYNYVREVKRDYCRAIKC